MQWFFRYFLRPIGIFWTKRILGIFRDLFRIFRPNRAIGDIRVQRDLLRLVRDVRVQRGNWIIWRIRVQRDLQRLLRLFRNFRLVRDARDARLLRLVWEKRAIRMLWLFRVKRNERFLGDIQRI